MERRIACLLCVLGLVALMATGTASAAEPVLPLGTDGHGIHLTAKRVGKRPYRHKELVLTFDASAATLFGQVAGRWLVLECTRFGRHPGMFSANSSASMEQRAPRHRRPIALEFGGRYDLCAIGVRRGPRAVTTITHIPLTPLGAEHLDEHNVATVVVAAARMLSRPERPSAAAVAATFHGVALAAPAETPPPTVLGVYSDGAEHVYAAEVDRSGKLLFVDLEHDVTRTNLVNYLLGEDPLGIYY